MQAPGPRELREALDSVFATPLYRWADEPGPLKLLRDWWHRLGDWLVGLRAANPTAFRLLVLALLLILLLIFAHAVYVVWRTARAAGRPTEPEQRASRESRDSSWYSRAADRAAAEGRLVEALQLAFVALTLTLHGQRVVDFHASKTPAEYAREARLAEADRERLGALVRALYAHVFGGRPLGLEEYQRWRDAGAPPWHAAAD
jgi:Domain of unknown function (DUF4129)